MKTLFTKDFYKKTEGNYKILNSCDCEQRMKWYADLGLEERTIAIMVYHECKKHLIENYTRLYKKWLSDNTVSGKSAQEIKERARFIKDYEYTCYRFSVFREKYNLTK